MTNEEYANTLKIGQKMYIYSNFLGPIEHIFNGKHELGYFEFLLSNSSSTKRCVDLADIKMYSTSEELACLKYYLNQSNELSTNIKNLKNKLTEKEQKLKDLNTEFGHLREKYPIEFL